MSAPVENLRRFFVSNPPWVLFLISLAIMAIGVTVLAYHINFDRRLFDRENDNNIVHFCWLNRSRNKLKPNKPVAFSVSENVSVSVQLIVQEKFVNFINSARFPVVRGLLYNGQLDKLINDSWSFDLLPLANSSSCSNSACTLHLVQACLIVHAEDRSQLPSEQEGYSCSNISADFSTKQIEISDETLLANERNLEKTIVLQKTKETLCRNGFDVTIQTDDVSAYVMFPMEHDSVMARLHLLYTSYFLMVTVLLVMCYALCRRSGGHRPSTRHHQDKEAAEEPQLPRYARLRE